MLKILLSAFLAGWSASALSQTEAPIRLETPVSADAFVDTIGINVHLHNANTIYGDFPLVMSALRDLGVRHTRDGLINTTWDEYYTRHAELGKFGIKCLFITGADDTPEQLSRFTQKMAGAVEGFEAPNEYDRTGGSDWAAKLSAFMPQLRDFARSTLFSQRVTVVGPSLTTADGYLKVPRLAATFDQANMHNYFGGHNPGTHGWGKDGYGSIAWNLAGVEKAWGAKPVVTTETGYLTDRTVDQSISEEVQGEYVPRIFLEQFLNGIQRTYLYELADGNHVIAQAERSYGIVRSDGGRKPAFNALQRLIQLTTDPGPAFSPRPISLEINSASPDLHHLLLQKRDGTLLLAFWLEVPAADQSSRDAASSANVSFQLRTKAPVRLTRLFSLDPKQPKEGRSVSRVGDRPLYASPYVTILQFQVTP